MKSPTSSVGTIELDGILNGSTRNERSRNTIRITGKKLTEYSTHHGCLAPAPRQRGRTRRGEAPQPRRLHRPDRSGHDQQDQEEQSEAQRSLRCSTARNASWGISTEPTCFMRFFPSFCFSSSLRLRVTSPP